jgi:hypothetical protein
MPYDESIRSMLLHGTALNWLNLERSLFERG